MMQSVAVRTCLFVAVAAGVVLWAVARPSVYASPSPKAAFATAMFVDDATVRIKNCKVLDPDMHVGHTVTFQTDDSAVTIQFDEPGAMAEGWDSSFVYPGHSATYHVAHVPAPNAKETVHGYHVSFNPKDCGHIYGTQKDQKKKKKIILQSDPNDIIVP